MAARQRRNVTGMSPGAGEVFSGAGITFYTRRRNFSGAGGKFFTRAGSFVATCKPNVYNQPPIFVYVQHPLFLIIPIIIILITSLAAHTMSLSRMRNHGPAKQHRDRGMIAIVTIGQPSNPATAG